MESKGEMSLYESIEMSRCVTMVWPIITFNKKKASYEVDISILLIYEKVYLVIHLARVCVLTMETSDEIYAFGCYLSYRIVNDECYRYFGNFQRSLFQVH